MGYLKERVTEQVERELKPLVEKFFTVELREHPNQRHFIVVIETTDAWMWERHQKHITEQDVANMATAVGKHVAMRLTKLAKMWSLVRA
jgi:hypothetical protein